MASIRKLPSGTWRAEVARKGVRRSATFPTKTAAKEWAARQEFLILEAMDAPPDHGAFADLLARYEREVSSGKRGGHWESIRIARLCKDKIAAVRLADLSAADFADWRDRRLREVAPASVTREMQLMSAALNVARREWGIIPANPISDVRRPSKPAPRDRLPTDEEIARMAHAAGSDLSHATARAWHAFRFALETAMRAGEIVALTWDRVDLDARVAHLAMTKSGRARDVPLSSEAIRLLRELPMADPVFGLESRQLDALFRKVRARAAIEGLTFHDSRHAAITRLAKKLDVLALARMVGHSDLRMLQVYYNESAAELAKRLD